MAELRQTECLAQQLSVYGVPARTPPAQFSFQMAARDSSSIKPACCTYSATVGLRMLPSYARMACTPTQAPLPSLSSLSRVTLESRA